MGGCGSRGEVNQREGGSTNSLITEPCHSDGGCRTVSSDSMDAFAKFSPTTSLDGFVVSLLKNVYWAKNAHLMFPVARKNFSVSYWSF